MKRLWIVAVTAAHLGALNADTDRPQIMDGNRFLFVVETSGTSSRLEHGGRQALVDLIYTGIYGQMRTGDTFGLWSFNEQVFAGIYPMQTWDTENTMELASNAGQFLKGQRYQKKGKFEPVVQEVLRVVRGVRDVNIFIISDAETHPPVDAFGPAFDREYAENVAKLPNSKTPLITTIVGRNGSISNWFVTVAGEPIRLPAFAVPPHLVPTSSVPTTVALVTAPRPRRAPIIIRRKEETGLSEADTSSRPKLGEVISSSSQVAFVSSLQRNTPAGAAPAPNTPKAAIEPQATPPIVANTSATVPHASDALVISSAQKTASAAAQPHSPRSESDNKPSALPAMANQPRAIANTKSAQKAAPAAASTHVEAPASSQTPLLGPDPLKVVARERTDAAPAGSAQAQHLPTLAPKAFGVAAATGPSITDRLFSPAAMVVIGALLLILAAVLGIVLLQRLRRPAQASFITQSLEGQ